MKENKVNTKTPIGGRRMGFAHAANGDGDGNASDEADEFLRIGEAHGHVPVFEVARGREGPAASGK